MNEVMSGVKALIFMPEPDDELIDRISKTKIYGLSIVERHVLALKKAGIHHISIITGEAPNLDLKRYHVRLFNNFDDCRKQLQATNIIVFTRALVISAELIEKVISKPPSSDGNQLFYYASFEDGLPHNEDEFRKEISNEKRVISNHRFICSPVESADQLQQVKKDLIKGLIKPTDGWVSGNLNRPISTRVSRILARTVVTPNQFTIVTGLLGLLCGFSLSLGGYYNYLIGAFLFHLTSVLDGVDGELARLKFQSSDFGQWLDTLVDNLTYIVALVGLIIGISTSNEPPYILMFLYLSSIFAVLALGSLYLFLKIYNKGGSQLNVSYGFEQGSSHFDKVMQVLALFGKRDLFALIFFLMAVFGVMPYVSLYLLIMTFFVFVFSLKAHWGAYSNTSVSSEKK